MKRKIVITDIDGCLNYYPTEFLQFVGEHLNKKFSNLVDLKSFLGLEEYEDFKNQYRSNGMKRELREVEGAVKLISDLKKEGYDIWVVTNRPDIYPVNKDTVYWLNKIGITYDELHFVEDKNEFLRFQKHKEIAVIIEDNLENIEQAAQELKIPIIIFNVLGHHHFKELENTLFINDWVGRSFDIKKFIENGNK